MRSVNAIELKRMIQEHTDLVLIDVREPWEHEHFNIGGLLIPLGSILEKIELVDKNKPVVFYCQKGIRSQIAIQRLSQKYNYTNLINLSGGMDGWKREMGE